MEVCFLISKVLSLPWTPYGIQCRSKEEAFKVHKFMREAILDKHVYISKIIGFTIQSNNTFRVGTGDYITRHEQLGESYPELMIKLQDKVFLHAGQVFLEVFLHTGMNNVIDNPFIGVSNKLDIEFLYENPEICRCLKKDVVLRVALSYDCGYKHMSVTCKGLDKEFFPCCTDFTIAPFYRVLPKESESTLVPIRYFNGATESQLRDILRTWNTHIKVGNVRMEEKLWLQSFGH